MKKQSSRKREDAIQSLLDDLKNEKYQNMTGLTNLNIQRGRKRDRGNHRRSKGSEEMEKFYSNYKDKGNEKNKRESSGNKPDLELEIHRVNQTNSRTNSSIPPGEEDPFEQFDRGYKDKLPEVDYSPLELDLEQIPNNNNRYYNSDEGEGEYSTRYDIQNSDIQLDPNYKSDDRSNSINSVEKLDRSSDDILHDYKKENIRKYHPTKVPPTNFDNLEHKSKKYKGRSRPRPTNRKYHSQIRTKPNRRPNNLSNQNNANNRHPERSKRKYKMSGLKNLLREAASELRSSYHKPKKQLRTENSLLFFRNQLNSDTYPHDLQMGEDRSRSIGGMPLRAY